MIDRTLIIVDQPLETSFLDDTNWTARPDGFWNGARFDVRSGKHAGTVGKITESKQKGRYGRPEFTSDIRLVSSRKLVGPPGVLHKFLEI